MAITNVTPGSWVTITTTTADTVFQNQSPREMYISAADTQATLKDGFLLEPWKGIVISTGKSVKVSVWVADGFVYYSEV